MPMKSGYKSGYKPSMKLDKLKDTVMKQGASKQSAEALATALAMKSKKKPMAIKAKKGRK